VRVHVDALSILFGCTVIEAQWLGEGGATSSSFCCCIRPARHSKHCLGNVAEAGVNQHASTSWE
jgi:hypothetical protein